MTGDETILRLRARADSVSPRRGILREASLERSLNESSMAIRHMWLAGERVGRREGREDLNFYSPGSRRLHRADDVRCSLKREDTVRRIHKTESAKRSTHVTVCCPRRPFRPPTYQPLSLLLFPSCARAHEGRDPRLANVERETRPFTYYYLRFTGFWHASGANVLI